MWSSGFLRVRHFWSSQMPKVSITEKFENRVEVKGSGDSIYIVTILGRLPRSCTCPSFEHRAGPNGQFCKHMKARHGVKAKGVTQCARCPNWLTPEDINSAVVNEIPNGSICCSECG